MAPLAIAVPVIRRLGEQHEQRRQQHQPQPPVGRSAAAGDVHHPRQRPQRKG